jgi:hypothetical protein
LYLVQLQDKDAVLADMGSDLSGPVQYRQRGILCTYSNFVRDLTNMH